MPDPAAARDAPKSRRDRPAKAPLSQEAIVEVALALIEREGVEAVTMRRVAQELDTGPASLYVYISNRQHLLGLAYDRVVAEITVPEDGDWQERLTGLLRNSVAVLGKRRGLALTALGTIPTGGNAMLVQEQVIGLLRGGGLDDATIAWAVDLLALLVTAAAVEESIYGDRLADGENMDDMLRSVDMAFAGLPPEQFPNVSALRPLLMAGSGDDRFSWWIQVVLNGLAATSPPALDPSPGVAPEGGGDRA